MWQGVDWRRPRVPHLFASEGCWYLVLAEGGTERGHAVTMARSHHPSGPFEGCPGNPILSHRSSIDPAQNTGHADLVSTGPTADGQPSTSAPDHEAQSPGFHVLGRETFLAGVDWVEGWPSVDEGRFPARRHRRQRVRRLIRPRRAGLSAGSCPAATPSELVQLDPSGGLWIQPADDAADRLPITVSVLCARVRDLRWSAEATFDSPGRFLLRLDDRHAYGLTRTADRVQATARIGDLDVVVAERSRPARTGASCGSTPSTRRRRRCRSATAGPTTLCCRCPTATARQELARLDGRYLSSEVASGFTGRMLALGATTGPARVTSVAYRPARPLVDSDLGHAPVTTKEYA